MKKNYWVHLQQSKTLLLQYHRKKQDFFKNVLHKESTVPKHSVFLLQLQHSDIDVHVKTVTCIHIFKTTPMLS